MGHQIEYLDYHCSTTEKQILKDLNRFAYDPQETSSYHGNLKFHRDIVCANRAEAMKEELEKFGVLCEIYENLGFELPEFYSFNLEEVKEAVLHDKKASNRNCSVVFVSEIGKGSIEEWPMEAVLERLEF